MAEARRRGVAAHKLVPWVRRQLGGGILVLRFLADGSTACSAPCAACAREIKRFDLRVLCLQLSGEWYSGRLGVAGAPACTTLTTGQRRELKRRRAYSEAAARAPAGCGKG